MQNFITAFATTIAVINGFVALALRSVPADDWRTQMKLLIFVGVISVAVIAATWYGSYRSYSDQKAERARKTEIRERLGEFIARGNEMMNTVRCREIGEVVQESEDWVKEVEAYLLSRLGRSYITRLRDTSDAPSTFIPGLNDGQLGLWMGVRDRVFKLERFSQELPQ